MLVKRRHAAPLNALRTFEAAARHLSFSMAAQELFVTPAAVSHQIKHLEAYLGTALFQRNHRSVVLTPEGQALADTVGELLGKLDVALETVESLKSDGDHKFQRVVSKVHTDSSEPLHAS